ncbi:hypothetical protein KY289_007180 [Solanum tuberosum]|nr:hypothetical protein KY289_007180 [Solanum tuberosum]
MSPASSRVVSHSEDFIDRNAATKGLPRDLASSKVRLRARVLKSQKASKAIYLIVGCANPLFAQGMLTEGKC